MAINEATAKASFPLSPSKKKKLSMILIPNAVARSWQGGKQRPFCIEYSMYVPQKPHLHATQQGSDLFFSFLLFITRNV